MDSLYYQIDKDALYALVDAEVSKVADEAYAEDGTSLYDTVVLTLKDRDTIDAFFPDGLHALCRAISDIASYYEIGAYIGSTPAVKPTMQVYVPDFDRTQEKAVEAQIDRYLVLYACNALFHQRRTVLVPEYTNRVQWAMDNAITLLRKRITPTR